MSKSLKLPYDLETRVFFAEQIIEGEEDECEVFEGIVDKYEYRDNELFIGIDSARIVGQEVVKIPHLLIEAYLVSDTEEGARNAFYHDAITSKKTTIDELKKDIAVVNKKIAML